MVRAHIPTLGVALALLPQPAAGPGAAHLAVQNLQRELRGGMPLHCLLKLAGAGRREGGEGGGPARLPAGTGAGAIPPAAPACSAAAGGVAAAAAPAAEQGGG